MTRFILAWINHCALNIGGALSCVWYAIIPPQFTGHSDANVRDLATTNPIRAFWEGLTR